MFWGSKFTHFCASVRPSVRPSVRACRRPPVKIQVVIGVFLRTKNQEFRPDTFCAEPPQNARSSPLVKIPVEGLDCKKYHRPVRWPKIPTEGLDCKKIPSCVRASGRPAVKIQIVIGVFGGTKNPEFRPDTFCAEHLQNARTCRYKPQKAFFWQQNFYKFWFLSKVRAIWHHTVTRVLSLGRPEFRRKFNLE